MDEIKTIKCPSCGTEFAEGTMFCNECGARLDEAETVTTPEASAFQTQDEPQEPVIPAAEEHQETKKEARMREKAEKEAAKLQAKIDKKSVKMAEKAARKAERKKRNIWAIVLMVLFFAGMCYLGWILGYEYLNENGLKAQNDNLTSQNAELQEEVDNLEATVSEQKETIAANEESFKTEQDSASSKIDELSDKLVGAEEKIGQLQDKLDECEDSVEAYGALTEALSAGEIGYSSEKLYADHGVVLMKKSSKGFDVEIFTDGKFTVECVSGESAVAEENEGEDGEKLITFTPEEYGVSLFKVVGKKDIMYIAVIVE